MKFSFLLLTWNRYKFLEICLAALVASIEDPANCEIVIMDNGSTDKTDEVLGRYQHNPLFRIIRLKKNYGIPAYKKLFKEARGEYAVVVDDDVLEFPPRVDAIFAQYMQAFPDFGYIGLNVIQNEFTNGSKPGPEAYVEETRNGLTIQKGHTGGWCACFRRSDYRKVRLYLFFSPLSMKHPEDGFLQRAFRQQLRLGAGIIKDAVCLHASGPYYAKQYDHLDREIEKYGRSGLKGFVDLYKGYADKP
jgi:glycosyltransferase involved in cell wall biosynthesis